MTRGLFNLIILFLVQFSFARGDVKGNGGGALLCPERPLEILDFYEARMLGLQPDLGPPDSSIEEMAAVYLARLSKFSPIRAEIYKKWFKQFESEAVFLNGIPIDNIDDIGVILPTECEWFQIVNQNPILLPSGKKYLIDLKVWTQLSNLQKVGLIFHELIYRESTSITSKGLRELNAQIASNQLGDASWLARINAMTVAGLTWAEYGGVRFSLDQKFQIENNKLLEVIPVAGSVFNWSGQNLILRAKKVKFFENGKPQFLNISNSLILSYRGEIFEFASTEEDLRVDALFFHENGTFKYGYLRGHRGQRISNHILNVECGFFSFDSAGDLEGADLCGGSIQVLGNEYYIASNSALQLYAQGTVKKFSWWEGYYGAQANPLILWDQQKVFPKPYSLVHMQPDGTPASFVSSVKGQVKSVSGRIISFCDGDLVYLFP